MESQIGRSRKTTYTAKFNEEESRFINKIRSQINQTSALHIGNTSQVLLAYQILEVLHNSFMLNKQMKYTVNYGNKDFEIKIEPKMLRSNKKPKAIKSQKINSTKSNRKKSSDIVSNNVTETLTKEEIDARLALLKSKVVDK